MDVETQLVTRLPAESAATSARARRVELIGPVVIAAGIVWAILQPGRIALLHPRGQGLWYLLVEPPLLVVGAGILFALAVARPLVVDIEADGDTA